MKMTVEFKRPNKFMLSEFSKYTTAQISDAMERHGAIYSSIKPLFEDTSFCGPAFTVSCYASDNLMCHYALKFAKPGDIIVVDCGGSTETGYWGEIMSLIAIRKELGGLVNDGGVRDRSDLRKLKFPIFSKSVFPGGTVKYRRGFINRFIACGGVLVCPGDIIIGDGDGVVVVPLKEARNILKRAKAILKREIALKKQISSGKELFRLFGFSEIH